MEEEREERRGIGPQLEPHDKAGRDLAENAES